MSAGFHRIVVPTDFSSCSHDAWALAQRLARAFGSELIVVHVVVETPLWGEGPFNMDRVRNVYESARTWGREELDKWVAQGGTAAGLTVRPVLRTGVPHEEIVALASDELAALLVIGTHGRGGVSRALLGSVADRVVRLAPCPVLTVRGPA
jgi:nucleotide-binding universal stress UspA family protein